MTTLTQTDDAIVGRIEAAGERIQRVQKAASAVIFGQDQVIERTLVTILAGGHGAADRRARPRQDAAWSRRWATCSGSTPSASSSRPT